MNKLSAVVLPEDDEAPSNSSDTILTGRKRSRSNVERAYLPLFSLSENAQMDDEENNNNNNKRQKLLEKLEKSNISGFEERKNTSPNTVLIPFKGCATKPGVSLFSNERVNSETVAIADAQRPHETTTTTTTTFTTMNREWTPYCLEQEELARAVCCKGFPANSSYDEVESFFQLHKITDIERMSFEDAQDDIVFAVVVFASVESQHNALAFCQQSQWPGHSISIVQAKPPHLDRGIMVRGLPPGFTAQQVRGLFGLYELGEDIESVDLPLWQGSWGEVVFKSLQVKQEALSLNSIYFKGSRLDIIPSIRSNFYSNEFELGAHFDGATETTSNDQTLGTSDEQGFSTEAAHFHGASENPNLTEEAPVQDETLSGRSKIILPEESQRVVLQVDDVAETASNGQVLDTSDKQVHSTEAAYFDGTPESPNLTERDTPKEQDLHCSEEAPVQDETLSGGSKITLPKESQRELALQVDDVAGTASDDQTLGASDKQAYSTEAAHFDGSDPNLIERDKPKEQDLHREDALVQDETGLSGRSKNTFPEESQRELVSQERVHPSKRDAETMKQSYHEGPLTQEIEGRTDRALSKKGARIVLFDVPRCVTKGDVRSALERFGPISYDDGSIRFVPSRNGSLLCFVDFELAEHAKLAVGSGLSILLRGVKCGIEFDRKHCPGNCARDVKDAGVMWREASLRQAGRMSELSTGPTTIVLFDVPRKTVWQDVRSALERFGPIRCDGIRFIPSRNGRLRCFVNFEYGEHAEAAIRSRGSISLRGVRCGIELDRRQRPAGRHG